MYYPNPERLRIPPFKRYKLGSWFIYCPNPECADPQDGPANALGVPKCPSCGSPRRVWRREKADESVDRPG